MSYLTVLASWQLQRKKWEYVNIKSDQAKEIKAGKYLPIVSEVKGEGIGLPGFVHFDDYHMGIRFVCDEYKSEKTLTVENLYNAGVVNPNGWLWVSRYAAGHYAIAIQSLPLFTKNFSLDFFNEDTSDHKVLLYFLPYAKVLPRVPRPR